MKRRDFLKKSLASGVGLIGIPAIISSCAITKGKSPNGKINIAQIGFGRIAKEHDLPETIQHDICRIVAAADVDSSRLALGKKWIEDYYNKKYAAGNYIDVKTYGDYHEILADKSIDAVIISTPDHWHAQPVMEAAMAGKDVYVQKPAALTIAEGRQMANAIKREKRVFQIGSQQRSQSPWPQFHTACQLVRNGKIGTLKHVQVGLGTDPGCGEEPEMAVPSNLNYDLWLGSTPVVYYTEKRVHPQNDFSRPGWLRCEQFGAGMITGWGSHHIDTAHWAMGTELTGPVEVEGQAEFPKSGLWDVHGDFNVFAKYAGGVTMEISSQFPNGVRFEGSEGWIFVTRGDVGVTASDPTSGKSKNSPLQASDPKILTATFGPNDTLLEKSPEQHLNWLQCIQSRRETIAPAEVAHRSTSACLVAHIAMKLRRKLYWDPKLERFKNDDEANSMLARPQRYPYGTNYIKA